jgi:SAM-dependent methyltransferase
VPEGLVVDLGCGSGILAAEISRAGRPVLGIDLSRSMIRLARARAPRARFRVGSFRDAELPPCAAVVATGEIFSYLFDGRADLDRLFVRIRKALLPGGLFLFDVAVPGRVRGVGPVRLHREGDGWAILVTLDTDARRRTLTRRMTIFRRIGASYRRSIEIHRQHLFRRSEVESALRRAGFRAHAMRGYEARPFSPGQIGYLARKPPRKPSIAPSAKPPSSSPSTPRTSTARRRAARSR